MEKITDLENYRGSAKLSGMHNLKTEQSGCSVVRIQEVVLESEKRTFVSSLEH